MQVGRLGCASKRTSDGKTGAPGASDRCLCLCLCASCSWVGCLMMNLGCHVVVFLYPSSGRRMRSRVALFVLPSAEARFDRGTLLVRPGFGIHPKIKPPGTSSPSKKKYSTVHTICVTCVRGGGETCAARTATQGSPPGACCQYAERFGLAVWAAASSLHMRPVRCVALRCVAHTKGKAAGQGEASTHGRSGTEWTFCSTIHARVLSVYDDLRSRVVVYRRLIVDCDVRAVPSWLVRMLRLVLRPAIQVPIRTGPRRNVIAETITCGLHSEVLLDAGVAPMHQAAATMGGKMARRPEGRVGGVWAILTAGRLLVHVRQEGQQCGTSLLSLPRRDGCIGSPGGVSANVPERRPSGFDWQRRKS